MPGSLFDTNVWLAAVFTSHPFHRPAQQKLQQATPAQPAVFCRATQQSFLRLASTPALLKAYGATGLSNSDALVALGALLALPQVCEREEPPGTAALWHRLASHNTASPKGLDGCLSCRFRDRRWIAHGYAGSEFQEIRGARPRSAVDRPSGITQSRTTTLYASRPRRLVYSMRAPESFTTCLSLSYSIWICLANTSVVIYKGSST